MLVYLWIDMGGVDDYVLAYSRYSLYWECQPFVVWPIILRIDPFRNPTHDSLLRTIIGRPNIWYAFSILIIFIRNSDPS
jgi:hypothetical protein